MKCWSLDSKLHSSLCSCSCPDSQIQTIPKEAQRFHHRQETCTWNYWSVISHAVSHWSEMPMKMSILTSVIAFYFFIQPKSGWGTILHPDKSHLRSTRRQYSRPLMRTGLFSVLTAWAIKTTSMCSYPMTISIVLYSWRSTKSMIW